MEQLETLVAYHGWETAGSAVVEWPRQRWMETQEGFYTKSSRMNVLLLRVLSSTAMDLVNRPAKYSGYLDEIIASDYTTTCRNHSLKNAKQHICEKENPDGHPDHELIAHRPPRATPHSPSSHP